jgi:hypothetical protein
MRRFLRLAADTGNRLRSSNAGRLPTFQAIEKICA